MKHLANTVTLSRVFIALVFYIIIVVLRSTNVVSLFVCFFLIEMSDVLDGFIARKYNKVSDLGKLLDPLCDVSAHFLCIFAFQQIGLAPASVLAIFVLREVWVQMIRMQLLKYKQVLAAKFLGKIKTWLFGMALFTSLLVYPDSILFPYALELKGYVWGLYYLAGLVSVCSGLQYLFGALKIIKSESSSYY